LAGHTESFGVGDRDFWLVKTDDDGNMEWNKTYGGTNADMAFSVVETDDGGYALAGRTKSFGAGNADFWLIKADSSGNHEWNKTYGGAGNDPAHSMIEIRVVETGDGGYALAGFTQSFGAGNQDFWLIKVAGPPEYALTIHSMPVGVTFIVDGVPHSTSWLATYIEGTSVSVEMPEVHAVGDSKYYWDQWSDGNVSRLRTIIIRTNITLTACYAGPYYEISINSSPVIGVPFTINGILKSTPYAEWVLEGSYRVEMPEEYDGYVWSHWLEDGDTNRIKTIALPGTIYTAIYTTIPVGGTTVSRARVSMRSGHSIFWIASVPVIMFASVTSSIYLKRRCVHVRNKLSQS